MDLFNKQGDKQTLNRIVLAVVLALITTTLMLMLPIAWAHDPAHLELDKWFGGLHSGKGLCCDATEAKRLDDVDWESHDGHYRVRIEGEWSDVPDDAVVDGPNLAGHTMVWPVWKDGHPVARCFMPGTMG